SGVLDWLRTEVIARGAIEAADMDLIQCTDDMDEACRMLTAGVSERAQEVGKAVPSRRRTTVRR
ncbi:MAG: TIGR00730 family Rossman fold protein, partial [Candidatus Limnocylindrales bacterium]